MSYLHLGEDFTIKLPEDFARRRGMKPGAKFWIDESENGLVLYPRRPDIQKLYIEPTTLCNLHCHTCIRNSWGDPLDHMSMETFWNLNAQLDELPNLRRVVFAGFGEPTFHPNIIEMVEAIRKRDLPVTLASNGTTLTEKRILKFIELGVDKLVVSVDGARPETFESIRDISLAKVIKNLEKLRDLKIREGSMHPTLEIEFVAMKRNVGELKDMTKLAAELQASRLIVTNVLPYTKEMLDEVLYGYEPQPPLISQADAGWPVANKDWMFVGTVDLPRMHWSAERRCKFIHENATVVGWDGGVVPCYALSHTYTYYALGGRLKNVTRYVLGNVNERSLADIWMSEEYVKFRSEVRTFHFPSCPDCDLRDTCDLRENNEGCWGWNPSCADCLWAQDIIKCP